MLFILVYSLSFLLLLWAFANHCFNEGVRRLKLEKYKKEGGEPYLSKRFYNHPTITWEERQRINWQARVKSGLEVYR